MILIIIFVIVSRKRRDSDINTFKTRASGLSPAFARRECDLMVMQERLSSPIHCTTRRTHRLHRMEDASSPTRHTTVCPPTRADTWSQPSTADTWSLLSTARTWSLPTARHTLSQPTRSTRTWSPIPRRKWLASCRPFGHTLETPLPSSHRLLIETNV